MSKPERDAHRRICPGGDRVDRRWRPVFRQRYVPGKTDSVRELLPWFGGRIAGRRGGHVARRSRGRSQIDRHSRQSGHQHDHSGQHGTVPGTVTIYGAPAPYDENVVPTLVQRGLTAQLVMQSFVTHIQNVDLDFRPGVKASRLGLGTTVPEVPTVPGDFEAITKKLEQIDIAKALEAFERTLASVNGILESPEVKQTIKELPGLVSTARHTLNTIDREVAAFSGTGREAITGSAASLQKTLASVQTLAENLDRETASTLGTVRGTFKRADTALDGANVLLDPRGRTVIQVQRAVDDLAATAARLRNLADRVDRDPSILIRGR